MVLKIFGSRFSGSSRDTETARPQGQGQGQGQVQSPPRRPDVELRQINLQDHSSPSNGSLRPEPEPSYSTGTSTLSLDGVTDPSGGGGGGVRRQTQELAIVGGPTGTPDLLDPQHVYNPLSLDLDLNLCNNPPGLPLPSNMRSSRRNVLNERSPLRSSTTFSEFSDLNFETHAYRSHRRTLQWAILFGTTAFSVLIFLCVATVALKSMSDSSANSEDNNGTNILINNGSSPISNGSIANSSLFHAVQFPIPDLKARRAHKFLQELNSAHLFQDLRIEPNVSPTNNLTLVPTATPDDEPPSFPDLKFANQSIVQEGLKVGVAELQDRLLTEGRLIQLGIARPLNSQNNSSLGQKIQNLSYSGYSVDRAAKFIAKRIGLTKAEASEGILTTGDDGGPSEPQIGNHGGCPSKELDHSCDLMYPYHSPDGTCNNLKVSTWGSALQPYRRILSPDYGDGVSEPRRSNGNGSTSLPNPRTLSQIIFSSKNSRDDPRVNMLFPLWGQFIFNDIGVTVPGMGRNGGEITCCEGGRVIDLLHPECLPITTLREGQFSDTSSEDQSGFQCLDFVRSAPFPSCGFGPREQFSQNTAFLDGSVIYGSSQEELNNLREFHGGLLKMTYTSDDRALLQVSTTKDSCNAPSDERVNSTCFLFQSGDGKVNGEAGLTAMYLLWTRHHNEIAGELHDLNPHWDDERLFQESRKILVAQLQHVTYNEFLPVLLGPHLLKQAKLELLKGQGTYFEDYDQEVDPRISNGFITVAARFGHSMTQGLIQIDHGHGPGSDDEFVLLHKLIYNPSRLWEVGGLDSLIKGRMEQPALAADTSITNELTNQVWRVGNSTFQFDLVASDLQRGRDHGIPGYPAWRNICGLSTPKHFEDLKGIWEDENIQKVSKLYSSIEDVDLFVGGLAEKVIDGDGGSVGPTFSCILADQFSRLRIGDRLWYEGDIQVKPFTKDQLNSIRVTTLARVICDSSDDDIERVQGRVLEQKSSENPILYCTTLPKMSYGPWKESPPLGYKYKKKGLGTKKSYRVG